MATRSTRPSLAIALLQITNEEFRGTHSATGFARIETVTYRGSGFDNPVVVAGGEFPATPVIPSNRPFFVDLAIRNVLGRQEEFSLGDLPPLEPRAVRPSSSFTLEPDAVSPLWTWGPYPPQARPNFFASISNVTPRLIHSVRARPGPPLPGPEEDLEPIVPPEPPAPADQGPLERALAAALRPLTDAIANLRFPDPTELIDRVGRVLAWFASLDDQLRAARERLTRDRDQFRELFRRR